MTAKFIVFVLFFSTISVVEEKVTLFLILSLKKSTHSLNYPSFDLFGIEFTIMYLLFVIYSSVIM